MSAKSARTDREQGVMRWLIELTRFAILLYLIISALESVGLAVQAGGPLSYHFEWPYLTISGTVNGVAGEPEFGWPLRIAIALNRLIYLYAAFRLWCMFGAFARKQYFVQATIRHLYVFIALIMIFTISRVGIEWLHFITATDGPDFFDVSELGDLGRTVLLFIIAHILNQARKAQDELDDYF